MKSDFHQVHWDEACRADCRELVRLGVREDLGWQYDWTTVALVGPEAKGRAAVVARESGVVAGLLAVDVVCEECDPAEFEWESRLKDGARVTPGETLGELRGSARSLLTAERLILNFLGRLSGIATLTRAYVDAVAESRARIYDTRKTTPAWRRLEKYAVRAGGGRNHRLDLAEAVLIKDNHLALGAAAESGGNFSPGQAVARAREFLAGLPQPARRENWIIEVEVDNLQQFDDVLEHEPDIVLLDNMSPDELREAVARRERAAPAVQLEASGGIGLENVAQVAFTGVDRISIGALTHAAPWLDIGLDWETGIDA